MMWFRKIRRAWVCALALLALSAVVVFAASPFKPIPASQVNAAERDKAQQIADSLWKKWNAGKFEGLSSEFTEQMRSSLGPALQKKAYEDVKSRMGAYKGLSFVEAASSPTHPGLIVYRFRGTFEKGGEKPEIRVVMDTKGKVGGFWIKPWHNDLQ